MKNGQYYFWPKRYAMFWNGSNTNFYSFVVFSFWTLSFCTQNFQWIQDLVDHVFDFLWTWCRNANRWYPITSWLKGFNIKASWTWGQSLQRIEGLRGTPSNFFFLLRFWCIFFTYVSDDFEKRKKILSKIFLTFFLLAKLRPCLK